jgi:YVTN family beta-propeller protein
VALLFALLAASAPAQADTLTPFAYVANANGGEAGAISVINTSTDAVTANVPAPYDPQAVAITPNGKLAYVANTLDNIVTVIDTATNSVVKTITIEGTFISDVAVSPDGTRVYATVQLISEHNPSVVVINTATNEVVGIIEVEICPGGVAASPDGARLYVANACSESISVIETATDEVIDTVTVGEGPWGVAVTPDSQFVYVTNQTSGTISVIEAATDTVVKTVTVGESPSSVAVTPDGSAAYVTNAGEDNVSVIETASNEVETTVAVGEQPEGVAVTPDGGRAYVTNEESNSVSVIDTTTNEVVDSIPSHYTPVGIAIGPPIEGPAATPEEAEEGGESSPAPTQGQSPTMPNSILGSNAGHPSGGVALAGAVGAIKGNGISLALSCPGSTPCAGQLKLVAKWNQKQVGKRHGKRRSSKSAKALMVGKTRFSIAGGHRVTVTIKLNSNGKAMLRRAGRRGLVVRLTGTGIKSRTIHLKPSRPASRQHRKYAKKSRGGRPFAGHRAPDDNRGENTTR